MEAPLESANWKLTSGAFVSNDHSMTAHPRDGSTTTSDTPPVNDLVAESLKSQERYLHELYSCFEGEAHGHEATQLDVQADSIANSSAFQEEDQLPDSVNSTTDFTTGSPFPTCIDWGHFLDMSSFLEDTNESFKEQENYGSFSELLADIGNQSPSSMAMDRTSSEQPSGGSTGTAIQALNESDTFCDSLAMGIPYYVACQWGQMQQTLQQQQQAIMMLWSQACLSGASNMMRPSAPTPSSPPGRSLPQGMNFTTGLNPASARDLSLFYNMCLDPQMRKRKLQEVDVCGNVKVTKYGRKLRTDKRVCKTCGTNVTPFWRKDKEDGRPLCNACGLYLAKNKAHRPKVLWKDNEKPTIIID